MMDSNLADIIARVYGPDAVLQVLMRQMKTPQQRIDEGFGALAGDDIMDVDQGTDRHRFNTLKGWKTNKLV